MRFRSDEECNRCGKEMLVDNIFSYPRNYYCPYCHTQETVDARGLAKWYDENGKQFSPIPRAKHNLHMELKKIDID